VRVLAADEVHEREGDRKDAGAFDVVDLLGREARDSTFPEPVERAEARERVVHAMCSGSGFPRFCFAGLAVFNGLTA